MPSLPVTTFGRRLREARKKAGIPQDRLGVQIGIDEGSASARISRYETGIHEPSYKTAVDIARELGVPTAYLFCDDDQLAKIILGWKHLSASKRKEILSLFT